MVSFFLIYIIGVIMTKEIFKCGCEMEITQDGFNTGFILTKRCHNHQKANVLKVIQDHYK